MWRVRTRLIAAGARFWAENSHSGNPTQRPRCWRTWAPVWLPFANLGEFEEGQKARSSLVFPPSGVLSQCPGPPLPQPWDSWSPAGRGWEGLAPKLAHPAQPSRRLLPALGAVLNLLDKRRAVPDPASSPAQPWNEDFGPCGPGRPLRPRAGNSGGLANPAAPGRPWGQFRARPLDEVPQRRPGPPLSSSCLAKLPPIWEVLWVFFLLQPWWRPLLKRHSRGWPPRLEAAKHGAGQPPLKSAKSSLA